MAVKGWRRDRYGILAYVKVGKVQQGKRFPSDTSPKTIQAWRDECRVALRAAQAREAPPSTGTLEHDIAKYLLQVAAMPTYAQRAGHLQAWADALSKYTPRAQITPARIREVLQAWRQTLGPATCNKRRTALMHLYTILDGKGARNPVRDVQKFRPPDALPRGKDPHAIDARLRAAPHCRSRACCRVLLWTGLRPVELARAEPDDLNLAGRTLMVRTAKGGRVRVLPLSSQALAAWREFDRADCWGNVPQSAPLNRWLKARTGMQIRVYDLRHSYGTALALRQTRLDVIGSLLGHSTLELSKRYTLAAVTPDAHAAVAKLARRKTGSRTGSFFRVVPGGQGRTGTR